MKTIGLLSRPLAAFLISVAASGCVTSEQFTLNKVALSGPVASMPVHVTIDPVPGSVQLIPGVAVGKSEIIQGSIDPAPARTNYVYNPPSSSPKGNLTWELPGSEYSLDLQYTATQHFALTAGGTYAAAGGYQFTNFRLGMGFFTVGDNFAVRLDAGALFNEVRYRSHVTVTATIDAFGHQSQYVSNFDDSGFEQSFGGTIGLTINSAYDGSPVNGFVNVGLAYQPLFDYNPVSFDSAAGPGDGRTAVSNVKSTSAILAFGGGIAVELGKGNRALLGIRGAQLLDVNSPAPRPVWQPFIEFVISF